MTYTSPLVPEWECYHRQYPFFYPFPHASATKFNNEKPAHTSWGNHALISKLGKGAVQHPPHSLKMSRSKHDRKFNSREWVQHSWYKVLQSWCKCTNSMCPTHPNGELFCGTKIPSRRLFLFLFSFFLINQLLVEALPFLLPPFISPYISQTGKWFGKVWESMQQIYRNRKYIEIETTYSA